MAKSFVVARRAYACLLIAVSVTDFGTLHAQTPTPTPSPSFRVSRRAVVRLNDCGQESQAKKSASWRRALARSVARGCWAAVKFVMARMLMILSKVNLTFARPSTPGVSWWHSSCESSWLGKPASRLCGANDFGWLGRSVWKNTRPPARRRLHLRLV